MLKKKGGILLTEDLVPASLEQVDLNSIHQAARVNFNRYNEFKTSTEEQQQELIFSGGLGHGLGFGNSWGLKYYFSGTLSME